MNELIGKQIDDYRLIRLLGEGGMGAVYEAEDLRHQRQVAVKLIHPHLARQRPFREQFLREAATAARLQHPSIIRIFKSGGTGDTLFICMELIGDGTLADHLQRMRRVQRPYTPRIAALLTAQIAAALAYAHEQGVVHGDVKPGNILLRRLDAPEQPGGLPARAVLTDFGLASLLEDNDDTNAHLFLGSLPYMSPEQCLSQKLDGRSDLYALGVICYQLTTGKLPFVVKTPTEAVMKHLNETPIPPRDLQPDLPVALDTAILKLLAKEPADRFQNGRDLAAALQQAIAAPPPVINTPAVAEAAAPADVTHLLPTDWGDVPLQMQGEWHYNGAEDQLVLGRPGETLVTQPINKDQIEIGRSTENDVVLADKGVSRHHARLQQTSGGWQIVDLGSINGTYLEGNRLLPDVPEAWPPEQTVKIGAFFLQWRAGTIRTSRAALVGTAAAAAAAASLAGISAASALDADAEPEIHRTDQLSVVVTPENISIQPGMQTEIEVALFNQGATVDHYQLQMTNIPPEWVTLPGEPLQLLPGERGTLRVLIHPPLHSSAGAGSHIYDLNICSTQTDDLVVGVPGLMVIAPFESFTIDMQPKSFQNRGTTQVLISNEGNLDTTFHVVGRDAGEALHFVDPRKDKEAAAQIRHTINAPTTPRWLRPILRLRIVRNLPFMRDLRSVQRTINRWSRFGKQFGQVLPTQKKEAEEPAPPNRLGTLHTRTKVEAGKQGTVDLTIEPYERPFLPKPPQLLPFEVQIATATGDPQILTGQVEVTSQLSPRAVRLAALLLALLLLPCAWLLYSLVVPGTPSAAELAATATGESLAATATAAAATAVAEAGNGETGAGSGSETGAETGSDGTPGADGAPGADGTPGAETTPVITDTSGITGTATITATGTPTPTATPIVSAVPDSFALLEDGLLNSTPLSVLDNDTTVLEDVVLTAVLDTGPLNGNLTLNANGTFIYQPRANFNGTDTFSYVTRTGDEVSLPAQVILTVAAINDPPEAVADRFDMDENTTLDTTPISVLGNDIDVERGTLTALLNRGTENGSLTLNGDGTFIYTPNPNFFGSDTFTYFA
ncbi:MAG: tandem-95 repeat protein, partial [Anaerolineales bacterium]|nr:tandem-95 repeat protein [Anaerolineales bacterium]